jgi:hypothetical protein
MSPWLSIFSASFRRLRCRVTILSYESLLTWSVWLWKCFTHNDCLHLQGSLTNLKMETENSSEKFTAIRDIFFQEPQIRENLFAMRAMSDDKDMNWYIRWCSSGTISVSKWKEEGQRPYLFLARWLTQKKKIFASNEAKWMHYNHKPIPSEYYI